LGDWKETGETGAKVITYNLKQISVVRIKENGGGGGPEYNLMSY